jgi:two-component system LytT family response regulator
MNYTLWLEDELHAETLTEQLKRYQSLAQIRTMNYSDELVVLDEKGQTGNVYFVQISNDKLNFLDQLLACDELPGLVFVLTDNCGLARHLETASLDYLQWPWSMNDFRSLMQRLSDLDEMKKESSTFSDGYKVAISFFTSTARNGLNGEIILPDVKGYRQYPAYSLIRLESEGPYTHVFTDDGKQVLTNRPLKHFDGILDPTLFIRVRSNQIINLNFLKHWKMEQDLLVTLHDDTELKVSFRWVPLFINAVNNRSKGGAE